MLLGVWEAGLRTFLPIPFSLFRPTIPLVCLGLMFSWRIDVLILALVSGVIQDIFGFRSDFTSLGLPLITLVLRFLAENVTTNRSVYGGAILALAGRVMWWIWSTVSLLIVGWLSNGLGYVTSWGEIWRVALWDIGFIAVYFLLRALISRFVFKKFLSVNRYVGS